MIDGSTPSYAITSASIDDDLWSLLTVIPWTRLNRLLPAFHKSPDGDVVIEKVEKQLPSLPLTSGQLTAFTN